MYKWKNPVVNSEYVFTHTLVNKMGKPVGYRFMSKDGLEWLDTKSEPSMYGLTYVNATDVAPKIFKFIEASKAPTIEVDPITLFSDSDGEYGEIVFNTGYYRTKKKSFSKEMLNTIEYMQRAIFQSSFINDFNVLRTSQPMWNDDSVCISGSFCYPKALFTASQIKGEVDKWFKTKNMPIETVVRETEKVFNVDMIAKIDSDWSHTIVGKLSKTNIPRDIIYIHKKAAENRTLVSCNDGSVWTYPYEVEKEFFKRCITNSESNISAHKYDFPMFVHNGDESKNSVCLIHKTIKGNFLNYQASPIINLFSYEKLKNFSLLSSVLDEECNNSLPVVHKISNDTWEVRFSLDTSESPFDNETLINALRDEFNSYWEDNSSDVYSKITANIRALPYIENINSNTINLYILVREQKIKYIKPVWNSKSVRF